MEINCKLVVTAQKNYAYFCAFSPILLQILLPVEFLLFGFESRICTGRLKEHILRGMMSPS